MITKSDLDRIIRENKSIAIAGHVNPDGDCIGSCTGLFSYIKKNYPDNECDIYLEDYADVFDDFIDALKHVKRAYEGKKYDLIITCDVSDKSRIAILKEAFDECENTLCIDHHESNGGLGKIDHIIGGASSTCEVLYGLLYDEKTDKETATSIYLGIVHDTGVFQYACTTPDTLRVAACLVDKGIDFPSLIMNTFYGRTHKEAQVLGAVLKKSKLYFDDRVIVGFVDDEIIEEFAPEKKDLDSIAAQLKLTLNTKVVLFAYPNAKDWTKISLRSSTDGIDVGAMAVSLGGGGHKLASGADINKSLPETVEMVLSLIKEELDK